MIDRIRKLLQHRFSRDLAWSYGSFAFLAVAGIAINVLIGKTYDADALGIFNQVYAFYILASQLGVLGLHMSALKHVAQYADEPEEIGAIVRAALITTTGTGSLLAVVTWFSRHWIAELLQSPQVGLGLGAVAGGLLFFALNKTLLGVLNGQRRMRAFAIGQATRFVLILTFVAAGAWFRLEPGLLPAAFTFAETLLFLGLLVAVFTHLRGPSRAVRPWIRRHLEFGVRGFLGNMLLELNARVDVLMLGYFASDELVGIYSFASMVAEGVYSLLVVIGNNVNPILVPMLADNRTAELRALVGRTHRIVYGAVVALALLILGGYTLGVRLLFASGNFSKSVPILAILLAGIVVASGYIPFDGILLQAGRPGLHTIRTSLNVLSNVILNAILIPLWGVYGAATATALALCFAVMYLHAMVRRQLGFSLGFFPRGEAQQP